METLTLTLPAMWADHHVLRVHDALAEIPGVESVHASARDFTVTVVLDPHIVTAKAIAARLTQAGYAAGVAPGAGAEQRSRSEWATSASRMTTTDPVDATMSGDYRKY
jgi:copper chaperone CopZ